MDKNKATAFVKITEARKVKRSLKDSDNFSVICFETEKLPRLRRGKGSSKKVQIPTSVTISNIEKLGGIETVKKILTDCIAANLKLTDYSNQI